jgi:hypothetical protein
MLHAGNALEDPRLRNLASEGFLLQNFDSKKSLLHTASYSDQIEKYVAASFFSNCYIIKLYLTLGGSLSGWRGC